MDGYNYFNLQMLFSFNSPVTVVLIWQGHGVVVGDVILWSERSSVSDVRALHDPNQIYEIIFLTQKK